MPYCPKCELELRTEWKVCPNCREPNPLYRESSAIPPEGTTMKRGGASYGAVNPDALPEGYIVDDRYQVARKLGQGGFGAVYLVNDRKICVQKALKIIPEAITNDVEAMGDLRREARTMVELNHPNIVRVYDLHDSGPLKYIDMEYVAGKSLTELKIERPGKRLPEAETITYAIQIARALAHAHSRNILHKDIKPQNILVGNDGAVKVMDFGIAETMRCSMTRLTSASSSGTLVYMSPEQLRGKDVGRESDIYSYGAMLYELLSGSPPFYRGDIQFQILNETPAGIEGVSQLTNSTILHCLKKVRSERPHTFDEIINILNQHTRTDLPPRPTSRPVSRDDNTVLAESLRVESEGGMAVEVFPAGIPLPCEWKETFSTRRYEGSSIEIHVLQGPSPTIVGNRTVGKFLFGGLSKQTGPDPGITLILRVSSRGVLFVRMEEVGTSNVRSFPGVLIGVAPRKTVDAQYAREGQGQPRGNHTTPHPSEPSRGDALEGNRCLRYPIRYEGTEGRTWILLPAGLELPCTHEMPIVAAEHGQTEIALHLLEGDGAYLQQNRDIGWFVIKGLSLGTTGKAECVFTFTITASGMLYVQAEEKGRKNAQTFLPVQVETREITKISLSQLGKKLLGKLFH